MPRAWLLDVDGVITDLSAKRITEVAVLDELLALMAHGDHVVLNTGRSLGWVDDRVTGPLWQRACQLGLDPAELFADHFAVIGEKGACMTTFDRSGGSRNVVRSERLPSVCAKIAQDLVESRYSGLMAYDSSKRTMVSVEMADGADIDLFVAARDELASLLEEQLSALCLDDAVVVDRTAIAVDVQRRDVGKGLGAMLGVHWLNDRDARVRLIYCAGDSPSDLEMATYLYSLRLTTAFEYLGTEPLPATPTPVVHHEPPGPAGLVALISHERSRRGR
jgi:hypothetical protein